MKKQKYLNNKDMLKEIHKSKLSFCSSLDNEYNRFDTIVEDIADVHNPEFIQLAKESRAHQLSLQAYETAYWDWHDNNGKASQKPKQITVQHNSFHTCLLKGRYVTGSQSFSV